MAPKEVVHFTSHRNLRHRLLLSLLSGKSIRIDNIRSHDVSVGLREHEISLLRLVEKVTNGSTIDISVTGKRGSKSMRSLLRHIVRLPSRSLARG